MGFFNKSILRKAIDKYDQQKRYIRVALCTDLFSIINSAPMPDAEMMKLMRESPLTNEDLAEFKEFNAYLAAQTVNYLFGEDIEEIYEKSNEQQKIMLPATINLIPDTVDNFFQNDELSRKIVVFTNALYTIFMKELNGADYLKTKDAQLKISIVEKYKNNIQVNSESIQPSKFDILFDEYYKAKNYLFNKAPTN